MCDPLALLSAHSSCLVCLPRVQFHRSNSHLKQGSSDMTRIVLRHQHTGRRGWYRRRLQCKNRLRVALLGAGGTEFYR